VTQKGAFFLTDIGLKASSKCPNGYAYAVPWAFPKLILHKLNGSEVCRRWFHRQNRN
jgi:hypothetical protein